MNRALELHGNYYLNGYAPHVNFKIIFILPLTIDLQMHIIMHITSIKE